MLWLVLPILTMACTRDDKNGSVSLISCFTFLWILLSDKFHGWFVAGSFVVRSRLHPGRMMVFPNFWVAAS